jgi:hypothetical protein
VRRGRVKDTSNPNVGQVDTLDGFAVLIAYNPGSGFGIPEALRDRIAFTVTVPTDLSTADNPGCQKHSSTPPALS